MQDSIQYIGEQPLFGIIGNLLIAIAFSCAMVAAIGYFYWMRSGDIIWKKFSRSFFYIHTLSIVSIFILLMYLILNHRFEYHYVWEHSNEEMPLKYIFACIWEGQEGSFLLWLFWHAIIGLLVIYRTKTWEAGVMMVLSLIQIFLSSMLLGIIIWGDQKIGTNPFGLLRNDPSFANLPFIKMPDYLQHIKGNGLNPLLQNYWMTIHPPTLFLGFALTAIPFCFAISGFIQKKYTEWIVPAISWTFTAVLVLGIGILMGAAWAYESLSFGGFWAWDPVENASLVPWMTLVAAAHVMLIYKSRKTTVLSSFILATISFVLVVYSTFLTRSGILGDTSVHAFTDLGMNLQLEVFLFFFLGLMIFQLIKNFNKLNLSNVEESFSSREFWMFVGVLLLIIGAIQITFQTSLPVINKLFNTKLAPAADVIDSYNKWQLPIAALLLLLIAITQFFNYKNSDIKNVSRKLLIPALLSFALVLISYCTLGNNYRLHYYILLFSACFAALANTHYIINVLKGKIKFSGSSVAHIGFALIMLGALISNSRKETISQNFKNINLGKDFPNSENIMIENRIDTLPMGGYYVVYEQARKEGYNLYYDVAYFNQNLNGEKEKAFTLSPILQLNERMGNVAEPSTKRFWNKDIYTHLTYVELNEKEDKSNDPYQTAKEAIMAIGDTFITSNSFVILQGLNKNIDKAKLNLNEQDLAVGAKLMIENVNRVKFNAEPLFVIRDFMSYSQEAMVDSLGLKIAFSKIDPQSGKITLNISELKSNKKDFIIMKAIVFPYINILWLGCILLIVGSIIAIRQRIKLTSKNLE
ncbi:MAG: hypothetical protein RIQ89_2230 [Bacteroidota bacterium]|jgi:cytochrome c-type biogenesis protein CcmF